MVVATLLHLFGQIVSVVYEICLLIGTATAAMAFLLGLAAYLRLWFTGDKGWRPASIGFFLGLACLVPAMLAVIMVEVYPSTADVTTAYDDPLALLRAEPNHPEIDPETVLQSFPNLITRIYQIPPEVLFVLAEQLTRTKDWSVIDITEPSQDDDRVALNAIRRSLLGWENEIAFRIAASPIGARIDLRAASLDPVYHDLGDNGRAIESFLVDLDAEVNAYRQDNPVLDEEEPTQVVGTEGISQ